MSEITKLIDMNTVYLGIGLIIFMIVNITLGSIDAVLTNTFDWGKFKRGIIKAIVVLICFILIYIAGAINADVIIINVNGQEVNILTAIYFVIFSGLTWYVKEVLTKLASLVKAQIVIEEKK